MQDLFWVAAMIGLAMSLFVPRRRVFARVRRQTSEDGESPARTVVEIGAIARGEDTGLDDEIDRALAALGVRTATRSNA